MDYTKRTPAPFILPEDYAPMALCFSTYGGDGADVIEEYQRYKLTNVGSMFTRAWFKGGSAIIGIRGTAAGEKGFVDNLVDDFTIAGFLGQEGCNLAIVQDAKPFVEEFIKRGFCEIIVAGHSLGGAAALCLAKQYPEITRAVVFNGAAPPTRITEGAGKARSRAYHIVGDLISTHIDRETCQVIRVKVGGDVNWGDPGYYHTLDRFYENVPYTIWSPQQEYDSMAYYVHQTTVGSVLLDISFGIISKRVNPQRLREFICNHPIPGSYGSNACAVSAGQAVLNGLAPFLGLIGGALLGFLTGGLGTIVWGAIAGAQVALGAGLLDIAKPGKPMVGAIDIVHQMGDRIYIPRPKGKTKGFVTNYG